ncbi:MAG: histone H1 [Gammaproteobacteria bacterium]|nr:histone H1 [Gammaproteobacteria bacterium]
MPKRPRDTNQLAKAVADMATGQARNDSHDLQTGKAAGGHARAAKLTAERRREIARKANRARWAESNA